MKNLKNLQTTILENLNLIRKPHEVVEVRMLKTKTGTVSGYYDNYSKLVQDIQSHIGKQDIYFSLNPVCQDLVARSANRLTTYAKTTTSDQDIKKISYILIDLDPVRPSGISSTDEEKERAFSKLKDIYKFLSDYGWPKPIVADSGNGYHLLYSVDFANTNENRDLLKQLLATLDQLFSDDKVHVDKTTFNPARIVKLYGTKACKGDSIEERPHRWSSIISKPTKLLEVSVEKIIEINQLFIHHKDSNKKQDNLQKIDVEKIIKKYNLGEYSKSPWNNGTRYIFKTCPFNENHNDSSFYIIQFDNGAIYARCHHDSCSGNDWNALKAKLGIVTKGMKKSEKDSKDEEVIKESVSDILLRLTHDLDFFSDDLEEAHVKIPLDDAVKVVKVKGEFFKKWLIKIYYDETGKAVTAEGLNQAINVLDAKGLFSENANRKLFQRVGKVDNNFYYDLCDDLGSVVEIHKNECHIINDSYGIFNKKGVMSQQVQPNFKVSSRRLLELIVKSFNFKSRKDAILYLVYLATCYIPDIAHPVLILHGEKGAAKSTTMRFTRMLVDPSRVPLISMPTKIDDLAGVLAKTHMICFDNLATIKSDVSDLLCMASTGGGYTKRKLYTDDEEVIYSFKRCICLNGIDIVATQPDLLDRSLLIELERIPTGVYQTEATINARFESVRAEIIGGCLTAIAKAKVIYSDITVPGLGRMADFMHWGYAIAEVLGVGGDNFVKIYAENQSKSILEAIDSHPVAAAVVTLMSNQTQWRGSVSSLLMVLNQVANTSGMDTNHKLWPKAPKSLSSRLKEVKSNLEAVGIKYSIRNVGTHKEITVVAER